MRVFIAIELSERTQGFLNRLQEQLKNSQAEVTWVKPQNIHLTLQFLGEIDDKKVSQVIGLLDNVVADKNAFYIRLSGIGAFPKISFPRIIWVGIDKGDIETKQIAKDLEEDAAKIGIFKENKPFSSHITIGRVRSALNRNALVKNLDNLVNNFLKDAPESPVNKITLFKSTLTPKGPIYEVIKEAYLKTN